MNCGKVISSQHNVSSDEVSDTDGNSSSDEDGTERQLVERKVTGITSHKFSFPSSKSLAVSQKLTEVLEHIRQRKDQNACKAADYATSLKTRKRRKKKEGKSVNTKKLRRQILNDITGEESGNFSQVPGNEDTQPSISSHEDTRKAAAFCDLKATFQFNKQIKCKLTHSPDFIKNTLPESEKNGNESLKSNTTNTNLSIPRNCTRKESSNDSTTLEIFPNANGQEQIDSSDLRINNMNVNECSGQQLIINVSNNESDISSSKMLHYSENSTDLRSSSEEKTEVSRTTTNATKKKLQEFKFKNPATKADQLKSTGAPELNIPPKDDTHLKKNKLLAAYSDLISYGKTLSESQNLPGNVDFSNSTNFLSTKSPTNVTGNTEPCLPKSQYGCVSEMESSDSTGSKVSRIDAFRDLINYGINLSISQKPSQDS